MLKIRSGQDLYFEAFLDQRLRKGVGGRGLATNSSPKTAKILPQNYVLLLIRGHRKKGAEKGPI